MERKVDYKQEFVTVCEKRKKSVFHLAEILANGLGSRRITPMKIYHFIVCCLLSFVMSDPVWAQSGLQTGIVGRIQIDPYLQNAQVWEISKQRLLQQRSSARVRRNSGHGPVRASYEPAPGLLVLLEGSRSQEKQPILNLHYVGKTVEPSQLLVVQSLRLRLSNDEIYPITPVERLDDGKIIKHDILEPGGTRIVELSENAVGLTSVEHPYSTSLVRVLLKARMLRPQKGGFVNRIFLESGDYKLTFYHGVNEVFAQPIVVPDNGFVAFDAVVERNLNVTVTLKDGALQVARQPPPQSVPPSQPPSNGAEPSVQAPAPNQAPTRGINEQPPESP